MNAASSGAKRRAHDNDGRLYIIGQDVMQMLRVLVDEAVERQVQQQPRTALGQFVDDDRAHACRLAECRKPAYASGRFQVDIFPSQVRYPISQIGEVRRGRELLELIHFLRALGLRRDEFQEFLKERDTECTCAKSIAK